MEGETQRASETPHVIDLYLAATVRAAGVMLWESLLRVMPVASDLSQGLA